MNIKSAAQKTSLSVHTIRYYDKLGLLPNVKRASNGHRDFGTGDIKWLIFIRKLKSTGMTIQNISRYLNLLSAGDHTEKERLRILEEHQAYAEEQLNIWRGKLELIRWKVNYYRKQLKSSKPSNKA